jgi:hypothetical protein
MEAPPEAQGQYFNIVYIYVLRAFAKVKLRTLTVKRTRRLLLNAVT